MDLPLWSRRWLLLFPTLVLALVLYCVDLGGVRISRNHHDHRDSRADSSSPTTAHATRPVTTVAPEVLTGFLVNTPGCRIPFLAPLDESVRQFVFPVKRVICEDGVDGDPVVGPAVRWGPALVEADPQRDVLRVRRDRAALFNVSDPARLVCCGRAFWRPVASVRPPHGPPHGPPAPRTTATSRRNRNQKHPNEYHGLDDAIEFADNCTQFLADEVAVVDEFVRVECSEDDVVVYRDVFGFTPPKAPMPRDDAGLNAVDVVGDVVDPDTPQVSVLIVGADSVSRSNLLRQMPRTVKVLKEIGAIDMLGYNKVEDNTFPNLIAVLTGLSVPELRERCWPTTTYPFDECPLIWKRFSALGYRTAYGEDEPWMGIFNYIKNGFARQPVDYYMRPYARLLLKELGHHLEFNCHLCVGPRFQLQALLDYAARFARLPQKLFGLFWGVSLTHDQLNTPQLADPLYTRWLRDAQRDGVLDKSVIVFLSDHGIRWGDIRETYQGRLEERLPFLMIALPRWLRERYPSAVANLRRNSRRLVTPYDLHRTLEDLMDLSQLEQRAVKERSEVLTALKRLPRGISMFLVAPETRSCSDAGIDPHWCTCYSSTPVPSNDSVVRRAADFVVARVNGMLAAYRQCEQLALAAVLDARREQGRTEGVGAARRAKVADYSLLLRTRPGGALFEATVRVRVATGTRGTAKQRSKHDLDLALAGTVSRVNRYGSQSACVADYHMKLYCYCKGFKGR